VYERWERTASSAIVVEPEANKRPNIYPSTHLHSYIAGALQASLTESRAYHCSTHLTQTPRPVCAKEFLPRGGFSIFQRIARLWQWWRSQWFSIIVMLIHHSNPNSQLCSISSPLLTAHAIPHVSFPPCADARNFLLPISFHHILLEVLSYKVRRVREASEFFLHGLRQNYHGVSS